jgi:hypothetical protein
MACLDTLANTRAKILIGSTQRDLAPFRETVFQKKELLRVAPLPKLQTKLKSALQFSVQEFIFSLPDLF